MNERLTPEQPFYETVKSPLYSAVTQEKAKLITVYASQPWRSAVVTAFASCPEDVALEVGAAFNNAVDEVFARHNLTAS